MLIVITQLCTKLVRMTLWNSDYHKIYPLKVTTGHKQDNHSFMI